VTGKLLLHIPEKDRFSVGLTMALNFLKSADKGDLLEARLLINAQGVTILEEEIPENLAPFLELGGQVFFCENALRAFNIPKEKVWPGCGTVPAGIRALVEWQNNGFSYVRA